MRIFSAPFKEGALLGQLIELKRVLCDLYTDVTILTLNSLTETIQCRSFELDETYQISKSNWPDWETGYLRASSRTATRSNYPRCGCQSGIWRDSHPDYTRNIVIFSLRLELFRSERSILGVGPLHRYSWPPPGDWRLHSRIPGYISNIDLFS